MSASNLCFCCSSLFQFLLLRLCRSQFLFCLSFCLYVCDCLFVSLPTFPSVPISGSINRGTVPVVFARPNATFGDRLCFMFVCLSVCFSVRACLCDRLHVGSVAYFIHVSGFCFLSFWMSQPQCVCVCLSSLRLSLCLSLSICLSVPRRPYAYK